MKPVFVPTVRQLAGARHLRRTAGRLAPVRRCCQGPGGARCRVLRDRLGWPAHKERLRGSGFGWAGSFPQGAPRQGHLASLAPPRAPRQGRGTYGGTYGGTCGGIPVRTSGTNGLRRDSWDGGRSCTLGRSPGEICDRDARWARPARDPVNAGWEVFAPRLRRSPLWRRIRCLEAEKGGLAGIRRDGSAWPMPASGRRAPRPGSAGSGDSLRE